MATRIEVNTRQREEPVEITDRVAGVVSASGATSGVALVHCPHTTAGVTLNEHADPDVMADLFAWLAKASPQHAGWRHLEGNADAHVKAAMVGSSTTIPIEDGRLLLGTWQGIFFCEFDGPRDRHIFVTVLAG